MTIATTRTRELDINRLILHAYRLASLRDTSQGASEGDLSFGRDCLQYILDGMQAEGLRARAVEFKTITLETTVSSYDLDTDTIDVVGTIMWIPPDATAAEITANQAGGELPLVGITRDDWQLQVAKDSTGRPLQYYCHRTASPPQLRVWPTPVEANDLGTLRMQVHRLAADSNDGAKTIDMERFWGMHISYAVARELAVAKGLSAQRIQYLTVIAQQHLEKCKSYSAQKAPAQLRLAHPTGWSR